MKLSSSGKRIFIFALMLLIIFMSACSNHTSKGNDAESENGNKGEIEQSVQEKDGWKLVFSDEFEGTELDATKWEHAPEWTRHKGQWSDEDAFLNGEGQLIIQVSERDGKYYSGAIRSRGLFEQAFGYYEMRAKLPKEEGFWTAFWLMSDSVAEIGNEGRDGTEIDIFETPFAYRKGGYIQHALHWDGYGTEHKSDGKVARVPDVYEGYHTFALEWNEDEYIFYIDDEETWRTSAGGVSQVPEYMKITAEVGDWGGKIEKANLPAQLKVDYVRVYEKIK